MNSQTMHYPDYTKYRILYHMISNKFLSTIIVKHVQLSKIGVNSKKKYYYYVSTYAVQERVAIL